LFSQPIIDLYKSPIVKKLFILTAFFAGMFSYSNAQIIDITGTGVYGQTTADITATDLSTIDSLVSSCGLQTPNQ
jgi:hypothetical protein